VCLVSRPEWGRRVLCHGGDGVVAAARLGTCPCTVRGIRPCAVRGTCPCTVRGTGLGIDPNCNPNYNRTPNCNPNCYRILNCIRNDIGTHYSLMAA